MLPRAVVDKKYSRGGGSARKKKSKTSKNKKRDKEIAKLGETSLFTVPLATCTCIFVPHVGRTRDS